MSTLLNAPPQAEDGGKGLRKQGLILGVGAVVAYLLVLVVATLAP